VVQLVKAHFSGKEIDLEGGFVGVAHYAGLLCPCSALTRRS
jgi:hypothetical protein